MKTIIVVLMLFSVGSVWAYDDPYNSYPYSYRVNPVVENQIILKYDPYTGEFVYRRRSDLIRYNQYDGTSGYQHKRSRMKYHP